MFYGSISPQASKYRISRKGRKLQISDDPRIISFLPRDVPERTWAEIMLKEENDLVVFDVREEIFEEAFRIIYERYMEKQATSFTVYCASQAWLKLIDWCFYRHDPGEEPSAYPPCFIPKRSESWIPDDLPEPSPKDPWCRQALNVVADPDEDVGEGLQRSSSNSSVNIPIIEDIPSEYWFPGKVKLSGDDETDVNASGDWDYKQESETTESEDLAAESELLQHITDYTTEELSKKESEYSALKTTTPVEKALPGASELSVVMRPKKKVEKLKSFSRASVAARSRALLPPLDRDSSKISMISDCRLKNLRLIKWHKWGTMEHIIERCPIHSYPGPWSDILDLPPEATIWLKSLNIDL